MFGAFTYAVRRFDGLHLYDRKDRKDNKCRASRRLRRVARRELKKEVHYA